jgi:small conductance mechanosensitive channel
MDFLKAAEGQEMSPYVELAVAYGLKFALALVIFFVGKMAVKIMTKLLRKGLERAKVDATLVSFLSNIAYGLAMAFVVIAALSQLGVQTASLAAIIAAAGLAVGLALQGSLSNFAAGVMLILFRPFKAGDFIDAAGTSGTVEEVSILTTILKTPDNVKIIAPNSQIFGGIITNYSANDTRRMDLTIGVSYSDDLDKVKEILERIIKEEERILAEPEPVVAVKEMADSSVNFAFRPWVKTSDFWPTQFDLIKKIKQTFDAEGISIPFPQRDVHLITEDALALKKVA